MRTMRAFLGCCAAQAFFSLSAFCAPQTGWWWNPAESGRGFFVESDNGITFIGAYLYEADGHATWLVSGNANADAYNYTGQLYSMSGGQTLFGSYIAPAGPNYAGTITVHFSDDTHGTVTWPGGTVAIERHVFGGSGAVFQPATGWWWNKNESGRGYSIEVQGDKLFWVGFMYDSSGRPVWYYSAGSLASPTTYNGPILQFGNGQTLTGAYRPPGTPTQVGNVTIDFAAPQIATLTVSGIGAAASNASPTAKAGTPSVTTTITSEFPKAEAAAPKAYLGTFLIEHTQVLGPVTLKITYSGSLIYVNYDRGCDSDHVCYFASKDKMGTVTVNAFSHGSQGGVTCDLIGVQTFSDFYTGYVSIYLNSDKLLVFDADVTFGAALPVKNICPGGSNDAFVQVDIGPAHFKDQPVQDELPSKYSGGVVTEFEAQPGGFYVELKDQPLGPGLTESGYFRFAPLGVGQ